MSTGLKANPDGSAAIQVGGTDVITLTSGGAATFVTSPTTVQAGTAAAPSITFSGDTNTGIYSPGADQVAIATGGSQRVTADASGNLNIVNGNLVIGTSGKGIDFSATPGTGTSELLADYEEGTFPPTIVGTTTAGTGTYSTQYGGYTKIGNKVYFIIYLAWSAHTGTGNMRVANMPFTSSSTANNIPAFSVYANGVTLTAGNIMQVYMSTSSAQIVLEQIPTGGGTSQPVAIDTNVAAFLVSGFYDV